MRSFFKRVLALLPGPLGARLKLFRKSFRGHLDRFFFPAWLLLQCLRLRRNAVVVWRPSALGDVVCTLPLCAEIRKRHPGTFLVFITLRGFDRVVRLSHEADVIYAIDHVYGQPSWIAATARRLGRWIDQVYEPLTSDERSGPTCGVARHLVDDLADSCGLTLSVRQPRLQPRPGLAKKVLSTHGLIGKLTTGPLLIGINGGHTWPVREWNADEWQQLIEMIHGEFDAVILQFGLNRGPGVPDEYNGLTGVHSLVNRLKPEELVALIAECDLIVSVDSGPVHIAGAVGTPVVGLYGALNPLHRLPPSGPGLGVTSEVPCLFCHHRTPIEHWRTGCPYDIRCMKQLTVATVFAAIRHLAPAGRSNRAL